MQDPRLKIVPLETNLGPAGAAQRAIDLATGEYVVRMDADDVMFPERIAEQVAFMDARPEVGASGSHQLVLGTTDEIMRASLTDEECRAGVLFQIPIFQPTSIYRRQVLVDHNIRFEDDWPRYGEDWWYQTRLLRVTKLANLGKPLLKYRIGDQNVRARNDRTAALTTLYKGLFQAFDRPMDANDLLPHLHAVKWFSKPLVPADVRAVAAHLDALRAWNDQRGIFPQPWFEQRLQRQWDELGYRLPPFGAATMLSYFRQGRGSSWPQLRYMASAWLSGRS